jgi:hypothetical protein
MFSVNVPFGASWERNPNRGSRLSSRQVTRMAGNTAVAVRPRVLMGMDTYGGGGLEANERTEKEDQQGNSHQPSPIVCEMSNKG